MVRAGQLGPVPLRLYPQRYVPLLKGAPSPAYTLSGRTFCWNSSMLTWTAEVPSILRPWNVGSASTNFGKELPSRGVWAFRTDAVEAVRRLAAALASSMRQPGKVSDIDAPRHIESIESR